MSEPGTATDVTPSPNNTTKRLLQILADRHSEQCYLVDRPRGRVAVYASSADPQPVGVGAWNRSTVDTARSAGLVDFSVVPADDLPAAVHQAVLTFEGQLVPVRRIAAINPDWGLVTSLRTMQARLVRLPVTSRIYAVHLVRMVKGRGTPGPALCGMNRFAKDVGWSMGGGTWGEGVVQQPCKGCVETALFRYPEMPVTGMSVIAAPIAKLLNVKVVQ